MKVNKTNSKTNEIINKNIINILISNNIKRSSNNKKDRIISKKKKY